MLQTPFLVPAHEAKIKTDVQINALEIAKKPTTVVTLITMHLRRFWCSSGLVSQLRFWDPLSSSLLLLLLFSPGTISFLGVYLGKDWGSTNNYNLEMLEPEKNNLGYKMK